MLAIRARELRGLVDAHVLVEADRTFHGAPKALRYADATRAERAQVKITRGTRVHRDLLS